MLITRAKDHLRKTPSIRHEKLSVELLVGAVQKTTKTLQTIAITPDLSPPATPSEVEGEKLYT